MSSERSRRHSTHETHIPLATHSGSPTLSVSIGRQMQLSDRDLETLRLGALLHDIGKIGVSDAVLRKPTKLTAEEFEQIKLHPTLGARILKPLRFLDAQLAIVELHHERPDGRGYPHGLKGDAIPLFARIVHVADAFDAMTSARAYRGALAGRDGGGRAVASHRNRLRCTSRAGDGGIADALIEPSPNDGRAVADRPIVSRAGAVSDASGGTRPRNTLTSRCGGQNESPSSRSSHFDWQFDSCACRSLACPDDHHRYTRDGVRHRHWRSGLLRRCRRDGRRN